MKMDEDIKEILEEIKEKNEAYEECSENGIIENEYYKSHLLLNYITNLQIENKDNLKCIKSLKEQLESVINENQKLLETWHKNNDKNINLISENEYLKETNEEHRKINGQLQEENNMLKKELKNKPDCEWTLETKDGQIMTIIQSERIDMQEKLNKSNQKLFKENQKLVKVIEEMEKWLKERVNIYEYSTGNMNMAAAGTLEATLNKLIELKGGSNEK